MKDHIKYISLVLEKSRVIGLYAKLEKCEFHTQKIDLLSFEITVYSVYIEKFRVTIIINWPRLKTVKNVQIFPRFANFYRHFVSQYSHIALGFMTLLNTKN